MKSNVLAASLFLVTPLTLLLCPLIGIQWISPLHIFDDEQARYVFMSIRVPRTLCAFIAGGALAVTGMIYQALFRNPLADSYTLGISSGASLGAALCIMAGTGGSIAGMSIVSFGAFAGAVSAMMFICLLAWFRQSNSNTLLLAGIIIATVCSGLMMCIHFVGGEHKSYQILRWIMGGVDGVSYSMLWFMIVPCVVCFTAIGIYLPVLDQLLTGDEIAHSRGINVQASRNLFIITTALAVGGIVALCGPIGFIGIFAPLSCRMIVPGIRHRTLSVYSFFLGGIFLVWADTLARSLSPPTEIPVGIITALLGGPFFLLVLFRRKNKLFM